MKPSKDIDEAIETLRNFPDLYTVSWHGHVLGDVRDKVLNYLDQLCEENDRLEKDLVVHKVCIYNKLQVIKELEQELQDLKDSQIIDAAKEAGLL